ncbi:MAG: hypothetical protein LBL28_06820, partial [Treponema sp.]|nr:hypothetical protein [Treponema sp.]
KQGLGLFLAVVALVFTGCPQPTDPEEGVSVPKALKGEWVSTYLENYQITDTEFSSLTGGAGYRGDIVKVISEDASTGYIIIRYTENTSYPNAAGRYYAVYYSNLNDSTAEFCGAYSSTDVSDGIAGGATGKASQAEAEAAYTVANGYFGGSSTCYKAAPANFQSPLIGTWSDGDSALTTFLITKQTVGYSYAWTGMLIGNIVNVRNLSNSAGYITFKYVYAPLDSDLIGKYCVLYWDNLNSEAGSADISIASYNWNPGDEGKATQAEAEAEYTIEDDDEYYDPLSCTKQ